MKKTTQNGIFYRFRCWRGIDDVKYIEDNLDDLMKVARRKWLVNVLDEKLFSYSHPFILELGSGSGCIPLYLKKNGFDFKYLGIDKKRKQLRICNKLFKRNGMSEAKCKYCDFDKPLRLKGNMFHQVWFVGGWVRGFKSKYNNVFKEVHRVLKPDGLFIFDVPSLDEKREKYKHRLLSKEQIYELLNGNFDIVSITRYERSGWEDRPEGHPQRTDDIYHYWGVVCKK